MLEGTRKNPEPDAAIYPRYHAFPAFAPMLETPDPAHAISAQAPRGVRHADPGRGIRAKGCYGATAAKPVR
jgi:hypothetical protein